MTRASAIPNGDKVGPTAEAMAVAAELAWLDAVIHARLAHFFAADGTDFTRAAPPAQSRQTALGALIFSAGLDADARLVLALTLAAHVQPGVLDPFLVRNATLERPFSVFGGAKSDQGFVPSGDTALFLVAGADPAARIAAMALLGPGHPLREQVGLACGGVLGPVFSGPLELPSDRVLELCEGRPPRPDFSRDFPAARLTTPLEWDDLILPPAVQNDLGHILGWLENETRILHDWGLSRSLKPGFRALFYGPPGTGKTLSAALLGKRTGRDVYRIDLSMLVSKYIGETEKNLAGVFDLAARKDWILFFDEADALFGARSAGTSSNDRYANQEVAYLLQRVEDCPGLVILATNLRGNIDDAFFRRFQASVGFLRPDAAQRQKLWRGVLGPRVPLADDIDFAALAADHDLTGGAIVNVARHAAVTALRRGSDKITLADLRTGVASELRKEGRTP